MLLSMNTATRYPAHIILAFLFVPYCRAFLLRQTILLLGKCRCQLAPILFINACCRGQSDTCRRLAILRLSGSTICLLLHFSLRWHVLLLLSLSELVAVSTPMHRVPQSSFFFCLSLQKYPNNRTLRRNIALRSRKLSWPWIYLIYFYYSLLHTGFSPIL